MRTVLAVLTLLCGVLSGAQAGTIAVQTPQQDWQQRRTALFTALNDVNHTVGAAALDAALTGFEKDPVSLTPMEAMDLYGVFYVPREGADKMPALLKVISMQAVLGWYDALRFADASGRAEIIDNEGFFKRAFLMGGNDGVQRLVDLLEKHPQEAAQAVSDGVALARQFRDRVNYDQHWPSAYGLTVIQCASQKAKTCPPPPALPPNKWDAAFEDAVTQVTHYYRKND